MPTKKNNIQDIKLAQLEVKIEQVIKTIESLTGKVNNFWNDLGHLRADVASLKAGQKITYGLLTMVLASLIALIFK